MVLQPSDERRRSGSHYTPRTLTEPIVETTFRPILERLGPNPTPEQILDLKVCDPAMGSGAFLVAVCRFLADLLVRAWHAHNLVPKDIPPDEDEILHARRIVAQRCLYGVDKNPMAVDLAKLSLWLATLAKDHPFTFLDHALKCGDSLVGLTQGSDPGLPLEAREAARLRSSGHRGAAQPGAGTATGRSGKRPTARPKSSSASGSRPPTGSSTRDAGTAISSSPPSSRPTTIGSGRSGSSRWRRTSPPSAASST